MTRTPETLRSNPHRGHLPGDASLRRRTRLVELATILTILVATTPGAQAADTVDLHDLFQREWEARLANNPLFATSVGRHEYDDRLPSADLASLHRFAEQSRAFLAELDNVDLAGLSPDDRVSARLFRRQLAGRVADFELGDHALPINADSGFHIDFARLPDEVPLATVGDYEAYLARLRAWPRWVGEQIERLRDGLANGMTQPRVALAGYEGTMAAHIVDDPRTSVFWRPFAVLPEAIPAGDRERLRAAGESAIRDAIVPGYRAFLRFFVDEYLPGARETLGASSLPNGEAFYAHQIDKHTSLALGPGEIHELGRREMARIRSEMEQTIRDAGFDGSFQDFLDHLRSAPRFHPESAEDLLRQASRIAKRMDGQLPSLFLTLPRLPYGVEPVPDELAPKYTAGRYVPAPAGSRKAGTYWVNTYDLPSRTLYTLEALTLHEAVPGHHLQIALARELEDLPPFRRFSYIPAFGEGWALYAERLGLEAGFYTDPASNFGRLTYEMWRACRLVVDTGLHAFGWTRQQAIDTLADNTALSLHECTTETDRYISWPGQALAYKLGELEIRRLRRRAEGALGPRFDLRAFHDAVLRRGSVTLDILADEIEAFVANGRAGLD